jgi:hypothetical protein
MGYGNDPGCVKSLPGGSELGEVELKRWVVEFALVHI